MGGAAIELTVKEFDLLRFLMQQPGRAFGRQTLLRQVWDYTFPDDSRTMDVHIQRLRAKIEPDPTGTDTSHTGFWLLPDNVGLITFDLMK